MDNLPESQIRQAVAADEFQRAQQLWDAYIVELEEEVGQSSFSAMKLAQVPELMEWSRRSALCLPAPGPA
jgi:hypothetical protein